MYINDIYNASKLFQFILFADDTNMFYCNKDISELIRQTNAELDKLNVSFSVNRLLLNIAKNKLHDIWKSRIENVSLQKINKVTINKI